jgi:antitoxin CptB
MARNDAQELGRLRWRCRRGMRELDELLTNYLSDQFPGADPAQRAAFEQLLECPDIELNAYCLGQRVPASPVMRDLVTRITTGSFAGH